MQTAFFAEKEIHIMIKKAIPILTAFMLLCGCNAVNEKIPDSVPANADGTAAPTDNISSEALEESISESITQSTESSDTIVTIITSAEEETTPAEQTIITEETAYTEETVSAAAQEPTAEIQTEAASDGSVTKIDLTFYETSLNIGDSVMPIVTMYPENAPDKSELWTSSDEAVACVDSMGNITAAGAGECTVKVQSAVCPEVYAEVKVKVKKPVTELTYIDGILIANKSYALPKDYAPGENAEARDAFDRMREDAAAEGLNIYISSAYRSYDYQSGLYERYVKRSGKAEADRYSARPGHSEHQTGLAFDLNTIDISFEDTAEYEWLKVNCADYGFIIRYPENGEEITGYMYEPWHIRYLGTDTARAVYNSGLTLEEYLGIDSVYTD